VSAVRRAGLGGQRLTLSFGTSSSSTSIRPMRPHALTLIHADDTCIRSTNEGAGSTWTQTLFTTSISDEHVA